MRCQLMQFGVLALVGELSALVDAAEDLALPPDAGRSCCFALSHVSGRCFGLGSGNYAKHATCQSSFLWQQLGHTALSALG